MDRCRQVDENINNCGFWLQNPNGENRQVNKSTVFVRMYQGRGVLLLLLLGSSFVFEAAHVSVSTTEAIRP